MGNAENIRSYSELQVLLGYFAHAHAIDTRPLFSPPLCGLGMRLAGMLHILVLCDLLVFKHMKCQSVILKVCMHTKVYYIILCVLDTFIICLTYLIFLFPYKMYTV